MNLRLIWKLPDCITDRIGEAVSTEYSLFFLVEQEDSEWEHTQYADYYRQF